MIRGDSGFCREPIMTWCEANGVDYVFGLAKNTRLVAMIAAEQEQARQEFERTKEPARVFTELRYRTLDSWSRERRVVAKAEHLAKGANPRFVVTSLAAEDRAAKPLYEEDYCGRGEMENRIKEQQLHLFADRTSAATMRANQVRLFFSSIAYVLLNALRRLGLAGTELAEAQCQTIRLKLLKIGALVRVTVRKVWVKLSSSCPYAEVFRQVHANLARLSPLALLQSVWVTFRSEEAVNPCFSSPGRVFRAERKRFRMRAVPNSTTSRARPAYRHPSVGRRSRCFASLLAGAPPRSRREKRVTRREHRGGLEACAGGQQQQQHLVLLVKNGPKLPTRFGEEPRR